MEIIGSIDKMQALSLEMKRVGKKIGFVPTMGCLHKGHLSLIDLLRGTVDVIIVSIYINPTQFGDGEDLDQYPRTLERDYSLCQERYVDVVFVPGNEKMYPHGFSSIVFEDIVSDRLCGTSRPTHFQGVSTICAKLFNICQPDYVALGQKDAQQVAVLKKMIKDLNFPIQVKVGDIIREESGLAMSSRNTYLNEEEKQSALVLKQSLELANQMVESGISDVDTIITKVCEMIKKTKAVEIDYVEIVDRDTMEVENKVLSGKSLLLLAVWVNKVRLIDNQIL